MSNILENIRLILESEDYDDDFFDDEEVDTTETDGQDDADITNPYSQLPFFNLSAEIFIDFQEMEDDKILSSKLWPGLWRYFNMMCQNFSFIDTVVETHMWIMTYNIFNSDYGNVNQNDMVDVCKLAYLNDDDFEKNPGIVNIKLRKMIDKVKSLDAIKKRINAQNGFDLAICFTCYYKPHFVPFKKYSRLKKEFYNFKKLGDNIANIMVSITGESRKGIKNPRMGLMNKFTENTKNEMSFNEELNDSLMENEIISFFVNFYNYTEQPWFDNTSDNMDINLKDGTKIDRFRYAFGSRECPVPVLKMINRATAKQNKINLVLSGYSSRLETYTNYKDRYILITLDYDGDGTDKAEDMIQQVIDGFNNSIGLRDKIMLNDMTRIITVYIICKQPPKSKLHKDKPDTVSGYKTETMIDGTTVKLNICVCVEEDDGQICGYSDYKHSNWSIDAYSTLYKTTDLSRNFYNKNKHLFTYVQNRK